MLVKSAQGEYHDLPSPGCQGAFIALVTYQVLANAFDGNAIVPTATRNVIARELLKSFLTLVFISCAPVYELADVMSLTPDVHCPTGVVAPVSESAMSII